MDLDADGFTDILTGQYNPGIITWFRGSKDGFLDGVVLEEDIDPKAQAHWYSACAFGDYDGDGDLDAFIGGLGGLRVNVNTGSRKAPEFGERRLLTTPDGDPLVIRAAHEQTKEQIAEMRKMYEEMGRTYHVNPSKEFKTAPEVVDWDGDGRLDLLVADYYMKRGQRGVTFFKGLKGGHFARGVPLVSDTEKWLPGVAPRLFATDWNEDGAVDLLIGSSIATVDGRYVPEINVGFEGDFGLRSGPGKDEGESMAHEWYKPHELVAGKDFRHVGVVYVLYGKPRAGGK